MALIVYGANLSPFVRKVRVALAEKGLEYKLDQVSPFSPPPEFLAISPLKRIPAFRDTDLPEPNSLADSSIICDYLEHKFQFVHVDDMARLIAHILRRKLVDPKLTVLNVAGRGEPLDLRRCVELAGIEVQRVPGRTICKQALRVLWDLGVSDIPPQALPYLLGSSTMDTARLRIFLGEHYRTVIEYTCEQALAESFAKTQQLSTAQV